MSADSATRVAPPDPSAAGTPRNVAFFGPVAVYVVLAAALLPFFRYLLGPDSISYISIAQHYADGYWKEAINTNWSPLMSWLMVPLLWIGISGLMAAKLFCIASGVLLLFTFRILVRGFELSPLIATLTMYAAAIMTVAFALARLGPDILVAALLLLYFATIFRRDYASKPRSGVICGLLGVASFLGKGYMFYFFIAHFVLMTGLHWFRVRRVDRARVLRHFAGGMLVFILCSAPWIWAMSAKAGSFNVGTTGAWNYRLVGPDTPGYPQYYHLIPPPGPHALSMWEQPSPDLLPKWSPLSSAHDLRHQIRLIGTNFKVLTATLIDTSVFSFAAVFAYLIWGIARGRTALYPWPFTLITIAFLPAGYLLVIVQDRYIWAGLLLILLAGAVVVGAAAQRFGELAGRLAIALYALSFLILPVRELVGQRNSGKAWHQASNVLRAKIPPHSRLASCGDWNDSLAVAYYLQLPFYGSTNGTAAENLVRSDLNAGEIHDAPPPADPTEMERSLRDDQISYYLVWPDCRVLPPSQFLGEPVAIATPPGVKLFHISAAPGRP